MDATHVDPGNMRAREQPVGAAGRYIRWLFGGALAAVAALATLYGGVAQTEYMPPPPLANNICIDEKLAFLREQAPQDPDFLVVGSSIAFRNIDSSVLARSMPGSRPVNGAFCGMRIHQAVATADWLIDQWPSIDEVLLLVGPQDFETCGGPATLFDLDDAAQFVFEREAAWPFYLRYFDPISFIRNAVLRAQRQNGPFNGARATAFTSYGDGPIESRGRELRFGHLAALDQSCFDALRSFASRLSREGREVVVVATPLHPQWKAIYDASGDVRSGFVRKLLRALAGTGAEYWNADAAGVLSRPEAFFDAVHVRWSAAANLTERIANGPTRAMHDTHEHLRGGPLSRSEDGY